MKYLFDTHPLLWMLDSPEKLSKSASEAILDPSSELYLSFISLWEIYLKISIGKLILADNWFKALEEEMFENNIQWLKLKSDHCAGVEKLSWHHRDPFDRMLVSQAREEGMALLSKDPDIFYYDVDVVW